jgi:exodeoxyribonuclease-3
MKFATWNVNSLTVRLTHVLNWLAANPVDALALQEIKLIDNKFPHAIFSAAGYQAHVYGQKAYNGVALLTHSSHAITDVTRGITGYVDDAARVIAATVQLPSGPLRLVNVYAVNGAEPGNEKFQYKLQWFEALREWLQSELATYPRLMLMGDFNVAPQDRDSFAPTKLAGTILHTTEEREHWHALIKLGLFDAFRLFEQPDQIFSWWDYRMLCFQRNYALRYFSN